MGIMVTYGSYMKKTENCGSEEEKVKFAYSTIGSIFSDANEYNKSVLENLIEQYGEEEGKRRYDALKQYAKERNDAIDRFVMSDDIDGFVMNDDRDGKKIR
mgnify:CR=1 FL=1